MNPYKYEKKTTEKRRLFLDVTRSLADGDSVTTIDEITIVDSNGNDVSSSLISGTPTIDGNTVIVIVINGVDGNEYLLRVRVNTTGLDVIQDNLKIFIKD